MGSLLSLETLAAAATVRTAGDNAISVEERTIVEDLPYDEAPATEGGDTNVSPVWILATPV